MALLALTAVAVAEGATYTSAPVTKSDVNAHLAASEEYKGLPAWPPASMGRLQTIFWDADGFYAYRHSGSEWSSSSSAHVALPTPVSQSLTGTGTLADPFTVTTVVKGSSAHVAQVDTYVAGDPFTTTTVTVTAGTTPVTGNLYRVGTCLTPTLGAAGWFSNNRGYGYQHPPWPGSIGCVHDLSPPTRLILLRPETPGSHYFRGDRELVYGNYALGKPPNYPDTNMPFPDTCDCATMVTHPALGLSWQYALAPGASQSFTHETWYDLTPPAPPPAASFGVTPGPAPAGVPSVWTPAGWTASAFCTGVAGTFTDTSVPGGPALAASAWDWGDASTTVLSPWSATATHAYAVPGTYTVRLTVTDADGVTGSATRTVTAVECKSDPVATFTMAGGPDCVDSRVRFMPAGSLDHDGGPVSLAWDFGDGATATGDPVEHLYLSATPVTVTLTVTDDEGRSTTATRAYPAPGDPNCPPDLMAVPSFVGAPGQTFTFPLSATDADGPYLAILGPGSIPGTLSAPVGTTSAGGSFVVGTNGWAPGKYVLQFEASDGIAYDRETGVIEIVQGESDSDRDGIQDAADNCPGVPNREQEDLDLDGVGDACQATLVQPDPVVPPPVPAPLADLDKDGVADAADNCVTTPNRDQDDLDGDREGDACDPDRDNDGVADLQGLGGYLDNCPSVANPDQADADEDGHGDVCGGDASPPARGKPRAAMAVGPEAADGRLLALVGLAAAAVLGTLLARRRSLVPALVVLFSRLTGRDLLENPRRAELVRLVELYPGTSLRAVARRANLSVGATRHHLAILVQGGLLWRERSPAGSAFFARPPDGAALKAALVVRSPLARRLADLVRSTPGLTCLEAAQRLGAPYKTVMYHVGRMERSGLITRDAGLRMGDAKAT